MRDVRVAVAEIATSVYRAYVAEGASSGEAEAAAAMAVRAERVAADGVRLAAAGLGRITAGRVGAEVVDGDPPRLDDPAERAPLLRLRLALDWVAATGRPILVPELAAGPGIAALAVTEGHADGLLVTGPAAEEEPPIPLAGLEVDGAAWARLEAAAARYLVPEAAG